MMASAELIVDVHHHYMPATLFDRLAARAGGRRIVTKEISLTLHPSRKDLHLNGSGPGHGRGGGQVAQ